MIWELRKLLKDGNNHKLTHLLDLYETGEDVKDELIAGLIEHIVELEEMLERAEEELSQTHEELY